MNSFKMIKAQMLIRKPVHEVFEAFTNPEITTKFWFTKSSGHLEAGKNVRWDWEMYNVWDEVYVKELDVDKRILINSQDGTSVEFLFEKRSDNETFVSIVNAGFKGSDEEIFSQCVDAMGGYTIVLCSLKGFLEFNIKLNLVMDHAPDAIVKQK